MSWGGFGFMIFKKLCVVGKVGVNGCYSKCSSCIGWSAGFDYSPDGCGGVGGLPFVF